MQAFLSLAQQHVELLLAEDLETNPANPLAVLDPSVDDEDALAIIAEYAGRDVSEIWPLVYGLMELVCDRLNQGEPVHGVRPGLIVRYCFHATGNQFADLSYNLIAQMERSNLDWLEEDLAVLSQLQREAETIADAYRDLNARLIADPAGLEEILARVIAAAASGCTPATTVIENETA